MWSLPNIVELNKQAEKDYRKNHKKTPKDILKGQHCEHCDKPATTYYEWYDIFSNKPKGKIFFCEEHDGHYGRPDEGYFTCEDCGKVFISNYTWENYYVSTENGDICLNCAFDREIKDDENWITSPEMVTQERVRACKHIIPVSGKHWEKHLKFIGNTEFDSMSGETLSGLNSTSPKEFGLNSLEDLVKQALQSKKECILILDARYQFSVSIGVYIKK